MYFNLSFLDAATINIRNLSTSLQEILVSSYYSVHGIEYNIGRIPIASCDFSTREYSYDDFPGDFGLSNFSLAKEDLEYKIPLMKLAIKMSDKQEILFFGSPWSAPAWMKTNGKMTGMGYCFESYSYISSITAFIGAENCYEKDGDDNDTR